MDFFKTLVGRMRLGVYIMVMTMMALGGLHALAQSSGKTISGKVVDESGEPLIGASVRIEGTTSGASMDLDGRFSFAVPQGKAKLLISYIGYKEQQVEARDGIIIKMVSDSKVMDAVVVTGMVSTDKRLFTGASDKLSADKIKLDGLADVSRGLEGRSAGVSVQNVSGTFGTAPKIRVRGATSI